MVYGTTAQVSSLPLCLGPLFGCCHTVHLVCMSFPTNWACSRLTGSVLASAEVESDDLLGLDPKRRRVHSSMYADLRTNLPRVIMGFSDFPNIPAALNGRSVDPRRFPAHPEVCGVWCLLCPCNERRALIFLSH